MHCSRRLKGAERPALTEVRTLRCTPVTSRTTAGAQRRPAKRPPMTWAETSPQGRRRPRLRRPDSAMSTDRARP